MTGIGCWERRGKYTVLMGRAHRCTRTAEPAVSSRHHHTPPRLADICRPSTKTDAFPDARSMPGVVRSVENTVNIVLTQRPPPLRQPRRRTTQRGSSAAPPTTFPTRATYSERGTSGWRPAPCIILSPTREIAVESAVPLPFTSKLFSHLPRRPWTT